MNSTGTQSTKSSSSSSRICAPKPIRRSGNHSTSRLSRECTPKCPFALSSEGLKGKSESLFDLGPIEEIDKDFQICKSDEFQAQREILSIIRNSSNDKFFDEERDYINEPVPERVKNPFFKNLE